MKYTKIPVLLAFICLMLPSFSATEQFATPFLFQQLSAALDRKDLKTIEKLARNPNNCRAVDALGNTMLVAALNHACFQPTKEDMDQQNPKAGVRMTAHSRWAQKIALHMISNGAPVNAQSKDGVSALMLAARIGSTQIVARLQAQGADQDAQDTHGNTPLMYAATNAYLPFITCGDIMNRLLMNGANPYIKNKNGHVHRNGVRQENIWCVPDFLNLNAKELYSQGINLLRLRSVINAQTKWLPKQLVP